jgi:DNA-binding LacI/PurR family transcriptional regulator
MIEKEPVTQEDVAERAGVSRSVVSYVLNNGPRKVSEETRQRVLAAIQELGYRPNEHAQRLKSGNATAENSIGILMGGKGYNQLELPYYSSILSGLYDYAYQQQHQISFLAYWEALKDPIFFNKHLHEEEISSLILILPSLIPKTKEDEKLLKQIIARIPHIVCLEETVMGLPAVMFDRAEAARSAMQHLIGLGHHRIAFVALNDQRLTGYKQSLLEANIPYNDALVNFLEPSNSQVQSSYDIVMRLLKEDADISAIFTATDEAAIGAMAAISDCGKTVPEDIAIVSIDNIEIAAMLRPALTTVDIPKRSLARFAIQSLMNQIEYPDQGQVSTMLPTKLIVRQSCGAKN